jgi:hypothetical protein
MYKNVCPQFKITLFGSLQSQKEMQFGPAEINFVPLWLGITHKGKIDIFSRK